MRMMLFVPLLLCLVTESWCLDFTDKVFGGKLEGSLAAFGDFNSDKLTDTFVIDQDLKSFTILLAYAEPPYLRKEHLSCTLEGEKMVGLVPGDFDGDAAMDVLILTELKTNSYKIFIAWGALSKLDCPKTDPLLEVYGHPLVLDYNRDMIADLFGLDVDKKRNFWIFNTNRTVDQVIRMDWNNTLRIPHSHGYVDLDGDSSADLLLTGTDVFEVWRYNGVGFELSKNFSLPVQEAWAMGQSIFLDVNFDGVLDHLVPVCVDYQCTNSSFYLYTNEKWVPIECNLKDPSGNLWTFQPPDRVSHSFHQVVTARSGDFNLDGYPDLLVTLVRSGQLSKAVLLENVAGEAPNSRKFSPRWELLSEWNSSSVVASTFYDVQEKGILDVLLVRHDSKDGFQLAAYKNTLDYDANFIKVLVLTGRCYANCSHGRIPYGTNLAGPSISYRTTQPTGEPQSTIAVQLSQSSYHSLQLPYTLFGLARSPNFLEFLKIGIYSAQREWTQIIPNSQMIIIPTLDGRPGSWLNKLFVTPSRAIVLSAAALAGFGFFLAIVVAVLHCRERRADKLEQLAVANRFHFDAM
nr:EOG090X03KG [Eurycercus lamellatus]